MKLYTGVLNTVSFETFTRSQSCCFLSMSSTTSKISRPAACALLPQELCPPPRLSVCFCASPSSCCSTSWCQVWAPSWYTVLLSHCEQSQFFFFLCTITFIKTLHCNYYQEELFSREGPDPTFYLTVPDLSVQVFLKYWWCLLSLRVYLRTILSVAEISYR